METLEVDIGRTLSLYRTRAGLTQRELARASRTPEAIISRIINHNEGLRRADTAVRIALALTEYLNEDDQREFITEVGLYIHHLRQTPPEMINLKTLVADTIKPEIIRLKREALSTLEQIERFEEVITDWQQEQQ
jgi:transcriptional regulator with XRE-family HTH domain